MSGLCIICKEPASRGIRIRNKTFETCDFHAEAALSLLRAGARATGQIVQQRLDKKAPGAWNVLRTFYEAFQSARKE